MKRIIAMVLCVVLLAVCLVGCKKNNDTIYGKTDLTKYVELADYKKIEVDTSSDEFSKYLESTKQNDAAVNDLFVKKEEGAVARGDTANIDYMGKKDGVAFEGGTAKGHDLTIGSGSFIPGFEDGLVGVKIGDTVDLNLTFPEEYGNSELAGQDVVFTVKVNYVTTTEIKPVDEFYKDLGFESAKEYEEDLKKRTIQNYVFSQVIDKSKVTDYPKNAMAAGIAFANYNDLMLRQQYGMTLTDYLKESGAKLEDMFSQFNDDTTYNSFIDSMAQYGDLADAMKELMVCYAIFIEEGLEMDEKADIEMTESDRAYEESLLVGEAVIEYLGEKANVK